MFVLKSYAVAVLFCVVTMICWGSWANTQKAVGQRWRFELFYWDYVWGVLLASVVFAFTLGSMGSTGRSFLTDLVQADAANLVSALLGGVVFNAANILLVAAIAISGMAVAFPVGIGLALVLGVLINYLSEQSGNPVLLFAGVTFVMAAIIFDAAAYRRLPGQASGGVKGLVLSLLCGILMSLFYFLVARAKGPEAGKLTPYTANLVFAVGIVLSNLFFNTLIMMRPFIGTPVPISEYFKGGSSDHLWGIIGGCIWGVGMGLNIVASDVASSAISYGLGQGATLVAALWGVFIWREFRAAPRGTSKLLAFMFVAYVVGIGLVITARVA